MGQTGMIERAEAFDLLVEACPSYFAAQRMGGYISSFEDADLPDVFVRTSAFAHHLVDRIAGRHLEEIDAVFATVERLLAEGDPDTVELVTIGLLEPLANIVSHHDISVSAGELDTLLGPHASAFFDDNQDLWQRAGRRRGPVARVGRDDYDGVVDPDLRLYLQAHKRSMDDGTLIGASDVVRYQSEPAGGPAPAPHRRPILPTGLLAALLLAALLFVALTR